jgi:hypothetical protein
MLGRLISHIVALMTLLPCHCMGIARAIPCFKLRFWILARIATPRFQASDQVTKSVAIDIVRIVYKATS